MTPLRDFVDAFSPVCVPLLMFGGIYVSAWIVRDYLALRRWIHSRSDWP